MQFSRSAYFSCCPPPAFLCDAQQAGATAKADDKNAAAAATTAATISSSPTAAIPSTTAESAPQPQYQPGCLASLFSAPATSASAASASSSASASSPNASSASAVPSEVSTGSSEGTLRASDIAISGSFGTKIDALVRGLIALAREQEDAHARAVALAGERGDARPPAPPPVKSLVFSEWEDALLIISAALVSKAVIWRGILLGVRNNWNVSAAYPCFITPFCPCNQL